MSREQGKSCQGNLFTLLFTFFQTQRGRTEKNTVERDLAEQVEKIEDEGGCNRIRS